MWVAGELGEGLLAFCQHQPVLVWCAFWRACMAVLDVPSQTPRSKDIRNKNNYTTWLRALVCAYLRPAHACASISLSRMLGRVLRTQSLRASLRGRPVTTELLRKKKISVGSRQLKDALARTEKREQRAGDPPPSRPSSEHSAK